MSLDEGRFRDLLKEASENGMREAPIPVSPDALWSSGRKRRQRRRGLTAAAGLATTAAVAALTFGSGILGGSGANGTLTPAGAPTVTVTATTTPQPASPTPSSGETPGANPSTAKTPGPTPSTGLANPSAPEESVTGGAWPSGSDMFVDGIRVGRHDGFDRVVIDVVGNGQLGWRAAYVDAPLLDGSGERSSVAGESYLEVILSGMAYPEEGMTYYDDGPQAHVEAQLDAVVDVVRTTPFEGQLQVFIGLGDEPRPFQVSRLTSPTRLVIDIATSPTP